MAETVIFEEQTIEVTPQSGISEVEIAPAPFVLTEGEVYRVALDGTEYELICDSTMTGAPSLVYVVLDENGEGTTGTFVIMYGSPELTGTDGGVVLLEFADEAASHTISIAHIETEALFPYQTVEGFALDADFGILAANINFGSPSTIIPESTMPNTSVQTTTPLTAGQKYKVAINGEEWVRVADEVSIQTLDLVYIGNLALLNTGEFESSGEPFIVYYSPANSIGYAGYDSTVYTEAPTVGLYSLTDTCTLTLGESYLTAWDGVVYEVVAQDVSVLMEGALLLGNGAVYGESFTGNNEPFVIGWSQYGMTIYALEDTEPTSHSVGIFKAVSSESGSDDQQEGIILKDRNGKDVAYYGIETVTFDTTTEGKQQVYSKGVAVEGVTIVPDFSKGDQTITAGENILVKSAKITAPTDLAPENVKKGKKIAGITGTFIGDTEDVTVGTSEDNYELTFANNVEELVITPSIEDKVISSVTIKKPDTLLPENIAKDVEIAGVVGTYASSAELEGDLLPYIAYSVNLDTMELTICAIKFSKLFADTGSYDINIPDKLGDFTVIIDSEGV